MYVCMYVCIKTLRARFGSARFASRFGSVRFASRFGSVRFKTRSHRIAPRSGCKHDDDDCDSDDDDDGYDDGDDGGDVDDVPTTPFFFA